MATLNSAILDLVRAQPGLTDRELTNRISGASAPQQPVNQGARLLERKGLLVRRTRPHEGLIGNFPVEHPEVAEPASTGTRTKNHDVDALSEDEIKKVLETWLQDQGWTTRIAWGTTQGIDIVAERESAAWIIEVKGPGSRQPMRVNYFLGILGETLQRMSEPHARYTIALPDLPQYRRLWNRLPKLAKSRTQITILFVAKDGRVEWQAE